MSPTPSRLREPIFNLPAVVTWSIIVLVGIHVLRLFLDEDTDFKLLLDLSVIPARWSVAFGSVRVEEVVRALQEGASSDMQPSLTALAHYILGSGDGEGYPWTALTYALLHGSWAHVLINSVWLAAFGAPIARRCGTGRFLVLAAASTVGGAAFYAYTNPLQILPMIGASAAVSGLMAAACWFMFASPAWLPSGRLTEVHEKPRETPGGMIRNRQVLIFLAVWFAANYIFAFTQPLGVTDASIAWEAHIGGFLTGLAIFPLLDPYPAGRGRISA